MKISKKVAKSLAKRQAAFMDKMPQSGQQCVKPGSQNRKKGASAK